MKTSILAALTIVLAALFVFLKVYTKKQYADTKVIAPAVNKTLANRYLAKDFTLFDLNGDETQLSDYRGSVVLLMFWTTW